MWKVGRRGALAPPPGGRAQSGGGGIVATRSTMTGTHRGRFALGPLAAIEPKGAKVAVPQRHFFRRKDGRAVDMWQIWDTLKLMRQLGAPEPDLRVHQVADPMLTSTDDDVSIIPRFVDVTATQGRREAMPVDATSREGGLKEQIRERYADFGPTLAAEKLREVHGITVGRETLRLWMLDAGLWADRVKRRGRV